MASILNLHTFYFFLIFACSFLEIYGKGFGGGRGGFGGGRGGSGGGRGGGGGGYSSRGSSSSGGSSLSSVRSSYKPSSSQTSKSSSSQSSRPSSSHNSRPSSSGSSKPSSSGSSGSSMNRGSSFRVIPIYTNHRNRMYGGTSDLGWSNNDYDRKSQEHYLSKVDDTEIRRPPAPRYPTSHPWNIGKWNAPSGPWRRESGGEFESLSPSLRREMERIKAKSKAIQDLSMDPFGSRRHRFQKRHACEESQCIHEGRRNMGDDALAVNSSLPLDKLGNKEAKERKPVHPATDSQADQKIPPSVM